LTPRIRVGNAAGAVFVPGLRASSRPGRGHGGARSAARDPEASGGVCRRGRLLQYGVWVRLPACLGRFFLLYCGCSPALWGEVKIFAPPGSLQSWAAHFVWFSFHAVCEPRHRFGSGMRYGVLSLRLFPQPREVSMCRLSAAWSPRAGRRFSERRRAVIRTTTNVLENRVVVGRIFFRCRSRRGASLDVA
jgi:hypothetical protein